MRINFECNCFAIVYQDSVGEQLGLACCEKHEKPHQIIDGLGLVVKSVDIERPFKVITEPQ